jgi:hypothetical protein
MNTALDVLRAAKRDWTPDKYCTGVLARNSFGVTVNPDDGNAVTFCAAGIIHHIAGTKFTPGDVQTIHETPVQAEEAFVLLRRELRRMYGDYAHIPETNDGPDGYAKIMAAIDNILVREAATEEDRRGAVEERELVAV